MHHSEKLAEAKRKFSSLKSDLVASEKMHHHHHHHNPNLRRRKGPKILISDKTSPHHQIKKSMHEIKLAFSEFYLSLILMQNYQTLNFTGFRKILKKHDKVSRE
jgi:SPX domain protein involved in polyphosphate accumulation